MDNKLKWIWLTQKLQMNNLVISQLLAEFDSIDEIYERQDYSDVLCLKGAQRAALEDKSLIEAERIVSKTEEIGAEILTYDSPDYPGMLRTIDDPPYVLYIKGEIMKWDRLLCIAVVGTRSYTDYGIAATAAICRGLAKEGVTIVSGMARGIDSMAAYSALKSGCKTIAVIGCGLDIIYPPENDQLMENIIKHGAVITEYPPSTPPLGRHFPQRNRIISGLSRGTLVVQAPLKSGAIITANYALDNGKDVFAVPGDINVSESRGTNLLIKTGAKLVENSKDILDEYRAELELIKRPEPMEFEFEYTPQTQEEAKQNKEKKKQEKKALVNNEMTVSIDDERYKNLDDDEKMIIKMLIEKNMHIDEIQRATGIAMSKLNAKMFMLETGGYIIQMPGKFIRINI